MLSEFVFKSEPKSREYSGIVLTTCQRMLKTNPEFSIESKVHEQDYAVTLKILNQPLIKFLIKIENKSEAKKVAAFATLEYMFPLAYKWILLHARPDVAKIKAQLPEYHDAVESSDDKTEHFAKLYKLYEAEITSFEVKQTFVKKNVYFTHEN